MITVSLALSCIIYKILDANHQPQKKSHIETFFTFISLYLFINSILWLLNAILMESFSSFLFFYFCFFFVFASFFCPAPPLSVATSSVVNATASATNSTRHHHKWIGPIGHRRITVSINGSGHFRSVQDAVDAVPENNRKNVLIQISPGYYM